MKEIIKKILPKTIWQVGKKIYYFFRTKKDLTSGDYVLLSNPDLNELENKYKDTWKDPSIPPNQQKITSKELGAKDLNTPFKEFVETLKLINDLNTIQSLLDIGCSSGYYSEVLQRSGLNISYEGCDYSSAFINEAARKYPKNKFCVSDATDLSYPDLSFDIVVSGCCILHIIDYPKAISESSRVAKKYVIFHRTPIIHKSKTSFFEKIGYGLKMFEIFFNESELYELFRKNNLVVKNVITLSQKNLPQLPEPMFSKTYLCEKI